VVRLDSEGEGRRKEFPGFLSDVWGDIITPTPPLKPSLKPHIHNTSLPYVAKQEVALPWWQKVEDGLIKVSDGLVWVVPTYNWFAFKANQCYKGDCYGGSTCQVLSCFHP
jgi:hypothetical protein